MMRISGRLSLAWTLLSPLSHIGESVGPDSYLATQSILDPAGRPTEVFVYSGNAIRGMLRDAGAKYLLDHLSRDSIVQVPLEVFYLLWSGGAIGGDQKIDIDQARRIRKVMPHLSIFGGGVGNQIMPGKLSVSDALPLCAETQHLLPGQWRKPNAVSWRAMTAERSYTRTDDAKDENKRVYLIDPADQLEALPGGQQVSMLADPDAERRRQEKRDKAQSKPQQMRYTVEVLQPGAQLWSEIDFIDLLEVELGALVAAFDEWAKRPTIGGKANVGMGRVALESHLSINTYDEPEAFLAVNQEDRFLSRRATEARDSYDDYLGKYREHLETNREGMVRLIGGEV